MKKPRLLGAVRACLAILSLRKLGERERVSKLKLSGAIFASLLLFGQATVAAVLHLEATAVMNSTDALFADYMPTGTVVTASFNLDVPTGTNSIADISLLSGSISWNDGLDRTWIGNSSTGGGMSSSGIISPSYIGSSPAINNRSLSEVVLIIDLGEDPFTTSNEWFELMLTANHIQTLGLGIEQDDATVVNYFDTSTSSITLVPAPAAVWLFGSGLLGLAGIARRKKAA